MMAYAIFIMGKDGTLIGTFVLLTTILAGLAGYRLKKRIDSAIVAVERLSWNR
jgi:hypothetical protein